MAKKTDHKDDPRNPGSGELLEAKTHEATEAEPDAMAPPDTEPPPEQPPPPPTPAQLGQSMQLNAADEPIRHQQAAERLEIEAANASNVRNFAEHRKLMLEAVAEWMAAGQPDKAAIAQKVADAGG